MELESPLISNLAPLYKVQEPAVEKTPPAQLKKRQLTLVFHIIFYLGALCIATLVVFASPQLRYISWTVCAIGISISISAILLTYLFKGREKLHAEKILPNSPIEVSDVEIQEEKKEEEKPICEEDFVEDLPETQEPLSITITPPEEIQEIKRIEDIDKIKRIESSESLASIIQETLSTIHEESPKDIPLGDTDSEEGEFCTIMLPLEKISSEYISK